MLRVWRFQTAWESWGCANGLNKLAGSWKWSPAPREPRSTPRFQFQGDEMPRILLADDHSVVRRQVRQKLESEEGFEVCAEAANGLEAVTLTASALPDFAILDLSMPQMNGLEAARQIHQRFPTVEMLILTMYDPVQFMDEVIASGV